jgi:hypothetical protein
MKKILVLSFGLLVLMASCKKSNSSTDSTSTNVSFSMDGATKYFNSAITATKVRAGSSTVVSVTGITSASAAVTESFTLLFNNTPSLDSITARTYTDTTSHFLVEAMYKTDFTSPNFYDAGTSFWHTAAAAGVQVANHLVVTITSIDSKSIKGTFSGDFYYRSDPSSSKKTITGGAFYANF